MLEAKMAVKAKVIWAKFEDGGKKEIPPLGVIFYPTIKLNVDSDTRNWSFSLINKQFFTDYQTVSDIGFLMENAPHYLLKSGTKFTLYEGAKEIAYGEVI